MTMARRKPDAEGGDSAPPSFEDALAGLEAIVEAMEHEHLTLEELVALRHALLGALGVLGTFKRQLRTPGVRLTADGRVQRLDAMPDPGGENARFWFAAGPGSCGVASSTPRMRR